jgi:prevent-host-death family protein
MIVTSTDIQNNFGKYLDLASGQEIVITKNGNAVARLIGIKTKEKSLASHLVGLVPTDIDEDTIKSERLARQ